MLNSETFAALLEDRIHTDETNSSTWNSGFESTLDPAGLTQIMAQTQYYRLKPYSARKAYGLKTRPVPTRSAHCFSEAEIKAFEVLVDSAPGLTDNFDRRSLKAAYRQAVLKTHPDRGGNSESFQAVKKSYHILEALVKNEG